MIKSENIQELAYDVRTQLAVLTRVMERVTELKSMTASENPYALNEIEQLEYSCRQHFQVDDAINELVELVLKHRELCGQIECND